MQPALPHTSCRALLMRPTEPTNNAHRASGERQSAGVVPTHVMSAWPMPRRSLNSCPRLTYATGRGVPFIYIIHLPTQGALAIVSSHILECVTAQAFRLIDSFRSPPSAPGIHRVTDHNGAQAAKEHLECGPILQQWWGKLVC